MEFQAWLGLQGSEEVRALFGLPEEEELMEAFPCSLLQTYTCPDNSFTDARQVALMPYEACTSIYKPQHVVAAAMLAFQLDIAMWSCKLAAISCLPVQSQDIQLWKTEHLAPPSPLTHPSPRPWYPRLQLLLLASCLSFGCLGLARRKIDTYMYQIVWMGPMPQEACYSRAGDGLAAYVPCMDHLKARSAYIHADCLWVDV